MVCACVVLEINRGQDFISGKAIKGSKDISQTENVAKQDNKIFLVLLSDNRLSQRIFLQQFGNSFLITFLLTTFIIDTTIVIILIGFQEDNAVCFLVSEQCNRIVGSFFKITEADNITKGLD